MEMKLNKKIPENNQMPEVPVAPSVPEAPQAPSQNQATKSQPQSYIKNNANEQQEGRKMFANKKANIALGILGAVIVIGIIGLTIWVKM